MFKQVFLCCDDKLVLEKVKNKNKINLNCFKALEALVIICISHFRKVRIRAAPNPAQKSDPAPQHCVKNIVQCVSVQYTYTLYSIISMHVHVIVLVRVKIKKGLNF